MEYRGSSQTNMPVMGNATPRVTKAVEDAERVCMTDSHRYGYMISVAQGLEIELAAAMEYGHKHRLEAALAKRHDTTNGESK